MTKEIALKYGCNPNQKPARIYLNNQELPVTVLNGKPGYINFLDALNSNLLRNLKKRQDIQVPQASSMLVLQVPQLAHHLAKWKEKSILQVMKNYLCLHVRM